MSARATSIEPASPISATGRFNLQVNATYLDECLERTNNPDGTQTTNDLTGRHPDETFFRAFPEWRAVTTLDWVKEQWTGSLVFRWTDDMLLDSGSELDSAVFTDIRATYTPTWADDALAISVGLNNVFDEDPPACDACGVIGLSPVSHDLPGTVGYVRVTYQQ